MALNKEQAQQKVKEILDLARNEKKTLTYQDVMNKLSDLDIDADAIDAVFETLESEGINVINATGAIDTLLRWSAVKLADKRFFFMFLIGG